MNKEFVPYELAVKLKEFGFDEPCFGCYDDKAVFGLTVMSIKQYYTNSKEDTWNCAAPTFSEAFRWFREKYDLNYVIVKAESWFYTINGCNTQEGFNTYEEAELACLTKLIEIVQGGQDNE